MTRWPRWPLVAIVGVSIGACSTPPGHDVDAIDDASDERAVDAGVADDAMADAVMPTDADVAPTDAGSDVDAGPSIFATRVVSFEPGSDATFGQDRMPGVVLGPPVGAGDQRGGTDVVSLGRNGRICVAFDDVAIVDGEGTDFVVFENPFYVGGTATLFYELGEVSVSDDGTNFVTFPCDHTATMPPFPGCAGWNPVYSHPGGIAPDDVIHAGGDPFDLATVGLTHARYVCIRDLATVAPAPPTTGFDLDAIVAVHHTP